MPDHKQRGPKGASRRPSGDQKAAKRRRDLSGGAVNLPNWVIDDLARVTPKERVSGALEALGDASAALADLRYHAAVKHAKRAKELAPRDATVRETLGIAAYRIGDWKTALAELRAYRRMSGEITHMPVEMDVLRAQGRGRDVEKVWLELQDRRARAVVYNEGRVVYASYLIDQNRPAEALEVAGKKIPGDKALESDLRRAYVAARAAARTGDNALARRLANAIVAADPGFPGLDELDREIT